MREIVSAKNNEEDYFIVHKLLLFQIIQINQSINQNTLSITIKTRKTTNSGREYVYESITTTRYKEFLFWLLLLLLLSFYETYPLNKHIP